jgi:DNA-directed RNA polymerase subunit RPC12/RpoP
MKTTCFKCGKEITVDDDHPLLEEFVSVEFACKECTNKFLKEDLLEMDP